MSSFVQENLLALMKCLPDTNRSQLAKELMSDLSTLVLQNIPQNDMEYVSSMLFSEEDGLVYFLNQSVVLEEFRESKICCLEFLEIFLENSGRYVQKYTKILKAVCTSLFLRDKTAKVKALAVKLMIKIIELHKGPSEELGIQSLIPKIFLELSVRSGLSPTVKCEVYHLLGVLAKYFPESVMNYSDKLLGIYLSELKQQMNSTVKAPNLPVVAGCFHGLTGYLHSFTHGADEDPEKAKEIFSYMIRAISTSGKDIKRFEMIRAALNLLSKHIHQMSPYVYERNMELYKQLKFWTNQRESQLKKLALSAMEAFFQQMAEQLLQKPDKNDEETITTFTFYIREFNNVITTSSVSYEVNVAIRGYGSFAAPCKRFLLQSDVNYMFNEMMVRSEQIYLLDNSELIEDKIQNLPNYLESLSNIVLQLETVEQNLITRLECLTVLLIEHFPLISPFLQHLSYCVILRLILALHRKGPVFHSFLNHIVFQGIIRTCSRAVSHETDVENNAMQEKDPRKITYRDYLNLWQHLVQANEIKDAKLLQVDMSEKEFVSNQIYNEIVLSILNILQKLDLKSVKKENMDDESNSNLSFDPVSGLQPVNVNDFHILVNVVNFSKDVLETRNVNLFRKWVYKFGCQMIEMSASYPLVSGFYKMFALCLKICNKIDYFDTIPELESDSMDLSFSQNELTDQQQPVCLALFSKFVEEIVVSMYQYKDDLLASCLQVLLCLPKQLVEQHLPLLMPAMQTALRMGLSYIPLAYMALDALESWCEFLPTDQLKLHLTPILPTLNEYLKNSSHSQFESGKNLIIKPQNSRRGRSKVVVKNHVERILKRDKNMSFASIRRRILLLLGSLDSDISRCLIPEDVTEFAVAWDMKKHLKFAMPFADMKPVIYLDLFLPRVIKLAQTSSERQTKVDACELLHALILFMLGTGAQIPDTIQAENPMDKLYKHVFPACLNLACDVEEVSRQLFEPLMLQLVHWFTNNKKYDSAETKVLLDALTDGITHPTDTTLRDFSARCLKEFVIWSIKQTTPEKLEQNPINMKSLLKRVYSMVVHPNAYQRLGGALIFNSIYVVFREENSLVDTFILEILYYFIMSLAIAHQDEKSFGTQAQAKAALDHIERIITAKSDILNTVNPNRRCPKEFGEGTLHFAVLWLLEQCSRPQTEASHKSMQLVHKFTSYLPGVSSTKEYFKNLLAEHGPNYFVEKLEKNTDFTEEFDEKLTFKSVLNWHQLLLSNVDYFVWIFGENLLEPKDILPSSLCFFRTLNTFIQKTVAADSIFDKEKLILSPKQRKALNDVKCSLVIRLTNLIVILLNNSVQRNFEFIRDISGLWDLFAIIVLDPSYVGFDFAVVEVLKKLPTENEILLSVLKSKLPREDMGLFEKALNFQLRKCNSSVIMTSTFTLNEESMLIEMPQFIRGLHQLHKVGFDIARLAAYPENLSNLGKHLLNVVFRSIVIEQNNRLTQVSLDPSIEDFANKLLECAFAFGVEESDVVSCILDQTDVFSVSGMPVLTRGSTFLTYFGETLSYHLVSKAESVLPLIITNSVNVDQAVSVINTILDYLSKNRESRRRYSKKILESLLKLWIPLNTRYKINNQTLLSLLSKMFIIDSNVICNENNPSFGPIFNSYLGMIVDVETSLTFKSQVLDLLPFFTSLDENYILQLKSKLMEMADLSFPLKSTELSVGSPKYNEYIGTFSKVLNALQLSGSFMLLEFVISIVCREKKHTYEDQVQKSISNFIQRMELSKQQAAVEIAFGIFMNEAGFSNDIRRNTLERICLTLLRQCDLVALKNFFCSNINEIMNVIQGKDIKSSEDKFKSQLTSKIGCFQLIGLLYTRLNKDELNSKASIINESFCKGNVRVGNELTQAVTKCAYAARKENTSGELILQELRRQYHCAAHNALIAIIICTQTEVKFYSTFLFNDNLVKGEFLWENIVDLDRKYEFEVELQSAFERKRQFVSIREEVHKKIQSEFEEDEISEQPQSIHYLTSQYLSCSSLSLEVSQFDFSVSNKALKGGPIEEITSLRKTGYSNNSSSNENYLELEMDSFNEHECMGMMSALIQHLAYLNLVSKNSEMSPWMASMHSKMCNPNTNNNIKLFIAKLIINNSKVFECVAQHWISPLMQLIVNGITGREINFFNTDLLLTLLSWAPKAIPQDNLVERSLASRVVEFLLLHCSHPRLEILKNNLEIIKTAIELWKSRIDIPFNVIYENFNKPDPIATVNSVGIHMLSFVAVNGLRPYPVDSNLDEEKFFKALALNVTFKHSQVYVAAAEVIGLTMKYLAENEDKKEGLLFDFTHEHMQELYKKQKDHFINVMRKFQQYYPSFVARYLSKILFILPTVHGILKIMCLEIIQEQVENIQDIFQHMKTNNITNLITHRDEKTQVIALGIVDQMLQVLKPAELLSLLPSICSVISQPNPKCRRRAYEIFMWIYDNYRNEKSEQGCEIKRITQEGLIHGLTDSDLALKLTVNNYWTHETRMPTTTLERSVSLLSCLYSPAVEQHFLSYASFLLLEMSSRSPDFNRKIFEHPLSDCQFVDYSVDYSWVARHSSMTPMFTQSENIGSSNKIRATQEQLEFTPTQEPGGTFNWLTQTNVNTFGTYTFGSASSRSKLLFGKNTSKSVSPSKRNYPLLAENFGEDFLQPTPSPQSSVESKSESSQLFRLRKRFLKNKESTKKFFAKSQTLKEIRRQENEVIGKEKRHAQVILYRKYRIGDLPDIEINYSAIITLLQALANRDDVIAKILFTSLIEGILNETVKLKDESELRELFKNLTIHFGIIINKTTQFHSALIGFVMEIAFYNANRIRLDCDDVSLACIASSQQNLGINLLELYLNNNINEEANEQPKRKTFCPESRDTDDTLKLWLKLADLYKSLDNYDAVRGIFNKKFAVRELTRQALDFESCGNYSSASKLYKEALDDDSQEVEQSEIIFWEDSLLQCYNCLSEWKEMETFIEETLKEDSNELNLRKIWDDTFYQDHYLSHLIRSKLKLLLEDSGDQALLTFVDDALSDVNNENRRLILENRFTEELSLLYIIQNNFERASHYMKLSFGTFLSNWASNSQCNYVQQLGQMQRLQVLAEMDAFLKLMKKPVAENSEIGSEIFTLLSKWKQKYPHMLDSTLIWDDVTCNRMLYLSNLSEKTELNFQDLFNEVRFSNQIAYVNNLATQNNFALALKLLRKLHLPRNNNNLIPWNHAYVNVHLQHTNLIDAQTDKVKLILHAWEELDKRNNDVGIDNQLRIAHVKLQSESAQKLASVLEENVNVLNEMNQKYIRMIDKQIGKQTKLDEVVCDLNNLCLNRLKETVSLSPDTAQAHLELGLFCDKQLRAIEESETTRASFLSTDTYQTMIVESLLEAMKLNCIEAIQYFPRLLQITEKYPTTVALFKQKCELVPSWMFLGWVNQMVAILDKPEANCVHNILFRIVQSYPQALVYPLKLSSEGYKFDLSHVGKRNKKFVERIQSQSRIIPFVDKLISALDQLSDFSCLFRDYKKKIVKMFGKSNLKHETIVEIKLMKTKLFTPDVLWGKYRTQFAKQCASLVNKINPETITLKEFLSVCGEIEKKINEVANQRQNKNLLLNDFCPWLSIFNSLNSEIELEIPGQYFGKQKPNPDTHVKISGFDQNILSLASIRRPRRIIVRGHNERDYKFLVKQGEDIRLDQRIEQLFKLMNDIYTSNSECRSRRLKLTTYQVIPLTTCLGLVEWVEKSTTFRDFLHSAMSKEEKNLFFDKNGPGQLYLKWLQIKAGKNKNDLYANMYKNALDAETTLNYRNLVRNVPRDLLRRAFFNLCSSLESFVVLRNNFITSHAVVCISHYLLGIGDRHLSNFMLDLSAGNIVGIDFGHAFGTATQFLPVPELMPFRLTPQFLSFMEPLREEGINRATMNYVLTALRNNAHVLLNLMDVFVKEPSVDWKEWAQTQEKYETGNSNSDDSWYPLQKIAFARRKLNGDNPAYITRDELQLGHFRSPAFARYSEVCLGTKTNRIRSQFPSIGLSIQNQVSCLIDQATDENILGRTFSGWESWM